MKAVTRAIDLLNALTGEQDGLGLTTLCRRTGLSKSVIIRLLRVLRQHELVDYLQDTKKYVLGPRCLYYGSSFLSHLDVRSKAKPVMVELRNRTGESVALFVRYGRHKVCIDRVESPHELRQSIEVGRPFPIHAGASGKVLLAYLPNEQLEQLISGELVRLTPFTVCDREALLKEIDKIRRNGYAVSFQERVLGVSAVAMPIFGAGGKIVASLSISAPSSRISTNDIRQYIELGLSAAEEISRRLGHRPQAHETPAFYPRRFEVGGRQELETGREEGDPS